MVDFNRMGLIGTANTDADAAASAAASAAAAAASAAVVFGAVPNTPAGFGAAWLAWINSLPTTPAAAGVGNPYHAGGGVVLLAEAAP